MLLYPYPITTDKFVLFPLYIYLVLSDLSWVWDTVAVFIDHFTEMMLLWHHATADKIFSTQMLPLHSMNFPLRNMIVRKYWGATRILYLEQERLWWKVLFIANCFCSDFCLPNLWFDSTFYLKYLVLKVIIIKVTKWYDMVRPFLRKLLPIHHIGRWTKYRLFCIHKLI